MRPVVFVKYYNKASTIMSADQISEGLRGSLESRGLPMDDAKVIHQGVPLERFPFKPWGG